MPLMLILGRRRYSSAVPWIDSPYSHIPIIAAAGCAYFFRWRTRRQPSRWVWILPAVILVWNLFTWNKYPGQVYWTDVWDNFFGSGCGSSECLYELTVT